MTRHPLALAVCSSALLTAAYTPPASAQQIHVGFLWHMHQPNYYPYESILTTDANNRFSFSITDVHNSRLGPYTTWPKDAIDLGAGLPHLGAQVSFSGSLSENLDDLEAANINAGIWNNWDSSYAAGAAQSTSLGNPRLDLVAFGYHHPLMPLLDTRDIRMQIQLHKLVHTQTFGAPYSKGMFPPETAFHPRIIPALVAEGIDWVMVDNIHFDRACKGYPHTNSSNLFAPNKSDQVNPNPTDSGGAWVQLQNLWAPSLVSAPFGYQPHYVQHIDPTTGAPVRVVAMPAARYEGNEDGRGGYGAFLYDVVMDALLPHNTDTSHPIYVMLHHDGDNFGGGSEAYYHSNFQSMVNWASADSAYEVSTVQDYLDTYPVDVNDVIHVESGSWAGADNGDPEFKKWLGDPNASGWSPDRNSWAVLVAAKNHVFTADDIAPVSSMNGVLTGSGTATENAWHFLLAAEASDHWYWDGTEIWDSNVTRGCNQAVAQAASVLTGVSSESTPPTVLLPQREPYNPGGFEWGAVAEDSDFEVWTDAYDISGVTSATLYWRVDNDGENPIGSVQNETYAGGSEVGVWNSEVMTTTPHPSLPAGILSPTVRADRYGAMITGQEDVLIDYYVSVIDTHGNVFDSDIQHVWVGQSGGVVTPSSAEIDPDPAVAGQTVRIIYDKAAGPLAGAGQIFAHYGFDDWAVVEPDEQMTFDGPNDEFFVDVFVLGSATQLDIAFNDGAGNWDNNGGADWHFAVTGGGGGPGWSMDGVLDGSAVEVSTNNGLHLWVDYDGNGGLYVATEDAGEGNDHFVYLAGPLGPGAMQAANWGKAGQVAAWSAFLADENDNDYEGWFDNGGVAEAATGTNGGVLEGTIDLLGEFGNAPNEIYLAVGAFATADSGAMISASQVPGSNDGDTDLDADEYLLIDLDALFGACEGDANGDNTVDVNDISYVLFRLGGPPPDGDANGDGAVDVNDISFVLFRLGDACP